MSGSFLIQYKLSDHIPDLIGHKLPEQQPNFYYLSPGTINL